MSGNLPPIESLVDEIHARQGPDGSTAAPVKETTFGNSRFTWVLGVAAVGVIIGLAVAISVDPYAR